MKCPTCGAIMPPSSRFCELDGTRLVHEDGATPETPEACACGGSFEDGFCTICGKARPSISQSHAFDHVEQAPVPELAGLSDVGRRHPWNEDALSLAAEVQDGASTYVLVVCDGVSSARDSQRMAQLAAEVTRTKLLEPLAGDVVDGMRSAIRAAHVALCAVPELAEEDIVGPKTQAPGCTIVAALVRDGYATVGWVGDSRAYQLGDGVATILTHDHSWFNDVVDSGAMTPEEAAQAPERNAITRCLGPLGQDAPDQMPEVDVVVCDVSPGQMLLLCSDGLWKYASEPEHLARLTHTAPSGMLPLDISRHLVEYANESGGTDNITAAVLKLP